MLSLCNILLQNDKEADHAAAHVFKTIFEEVAAGRIQSDKEFAQLSIRKAVMHCKALDSQKSSRSFRVPTGSSFAANFSPEKMDFTGDWQSIVLKNLPTFHRYIYALNTICEYSAEQISRIFVTTAKVIENALDSEQYNVDKIVSIARRVRKELPEYTTQNFHTDLVQAANSTDVPGSVDATVKVNIQSICEPIQHERRKKGNILLSITGILALILVVIAAVVSLNSYDSDVDLDNPNSDSAITSVPTETTSYVEEVEDIIASYYADITVQDYGTITVALNAEAAPETVANFVSLAQSGFYDGLSFHRIVEGFLMQGGDPDRDCTGGNTDENGNKLTITGEFAENGFDNPLSHTAGAISMARSTEYNSASSQFFIVHTDNNTASLDGKYACFGYVTEGMDIVDAICTASWTADGSGIVAVEEQPIITSIVIREPENTSAIS